MGFASLMSVSSFVLLSLWEHPLGPPLKVDIMHCAWQSLRLITKDNRGLPQGLTLIVVLITIRPFLGNTQRIQSVKVMEGWANLRNDTDTMTRDYTLYRMGKITIKGKCSYCCCVACGFTYKRHDTRILYKREMKQRPSTLWIFHSQCQFWSTKVCVVNCYLLWGRWCLWVMFRDQGTDFTVGTQGALIKAGIITTEETPSFYSEVWCWISSGSSSGGYCGSSGGSEICLSSSRIEV